MPFAFVDVRFQIANGLLVDDSRATGAVAFTKRRLIDRNEVPWCDLHNVVIEQPFDRALASFECHLLAIDRSCYGARKGDLLVTEEATYTQCDYDCNGSDRSWQSSSALARMLRSGSKLFEI